MAPAALNSKLAGSPLVPAYVRLEAGLSGSVTNCASDKLNATASVAVWSGIVWTVGGTLMCVTVMSKFCSTGGPVGSDTDSVTWLTPT